MLGGSESPQTIECGNLLFEMAVLCDFAFLPRIYGLSQPQRVGEVESAPLVKSQPARLFPVHSPHSIGRFQPNASCLDCLGLSSNCLEPTLPA